MKTQVNIYIILDFNDMSMSNTILQCKFHVYFLIDLRHVQQSSAHIVKQILVSIPSAEQASILGLLHEMGMSSGCSQVLPKIPYPCNTNFGKCFQANACLKLHDFDFFELCYIRNLLSYEKEALQFQMWL